jgi:MFS transporter, DHA1 family, multidrug resistance protein
VTGEGTSALPARRDRTRILTWICILIAINQLGFGAVVAVLALYARSFGVSQSAIGLAIAIYGFARFAVAMPAGRLADRFGRRAGLALGGLVTAAGNAMCAAAPTYAVFIAGRFVAGAGAAFVLITGAVVLADITTPADRGRTMAIYQGVFLFAVGVGPMPGGVLAERFGLVAPFVVYTVTGVVAGVLAWLVVPETRRADVDAEAIAALPAFGAQVRRLTANVGFVLVSVISFVQAFARTGALFNVIPVLAYERLHLSAEQIGVGLGLASVVGLVLIYPSGMLVDRYGRKIVIMPATLVSGAAMLLFLVMPSYAWFLAGCVVWSVATGVSGAAPAAYAADTAPAGMNAAAMSAYRMLADLGYVIGPLALGAITDGFGAERAIATATVLLVAAAALFGRYAPETYRL